jgi:hypothetical protein
VAQSQRRGAGLVLPAPAAYDAVLGAGGRGGETVQTHAAAAQRAAGGGSGVHQPGRLALLRRLLPAPPRRLAPPRGDAGDDAARGLEALSPRVRARGRGREVPAPRPRPGHVSVRRHRSRATLGLSRTPARDVCPRRPRHRPTRARRRPVQSRWAEDWVALLCEAKTFTAAAPLEGLEALPVTAAKRMHRRNDAILEIAAKGTPPQAPPLGTKRGVKQSSAYNLVKRLREKCDAVLRFITDLRVPFDADQVERDIAMPKLKQKGSGTFRTDARIERFAR